MNYNICPIFISILLIYVIGIAIYKNTMYEFYDNDNTIAVVGCKTDADCNVVYGGKNPDGSFQNVCKSDHTCHCVEGDGTFCHETNRNYKDPRDMNREELQEFKEKYRNDFTVQDYRNWLLLYKDDSRNLREHHRNNLRKILKGGTLTYEDLPRILHVPPTNAEEYFRKMWNEKLNDGNIAQSQDGRRLDSDIRFPEKGESGAFVGANYTNYSTFIPPQNLEKTWITGTVDLYRQKVDPHELNYYIRPDVTTGDERSIIGNKFKQDELKRIVATTKGPQCQKFIPKPQGKIDIQENIPKEPIGLEEKSQQVDKELRQDQLNTGYQFT